MARPGSETEQNPNEYKDPGHPLIVLIVGLVFLLTVITLAWIVPFLLTGQLNKSVTNNFQQGPPLSKINKQSAPAVASKTVKLSEGEMFIRPSNNLAPAGSVTFQVSNQGQIVHELVVIKTNKPADSLGTGTKASQAGMVGEIADIKPGQSKPLKLKLAAGRYALICNLPGHYAAGMYSNLNVQ